MGRLSLPATLLVVGIVFAACGDGGSEPAPTSTRTPAATSTPTVEPKPTAAPTAPPTAVPSTGNPPTGSAGLQLPAGFGATVIADGFFRPTSLALAGDGELYISERHGDIFRLRDREGDGVYENRVTFASGFSETTGIVVGPGGALYVSSTGRVTTVRDTNGDGVSDANQDIITGLPTGRHQNNGLLFGPDGRLYLTNGSTCDECDEADVRSATILRANGDGSDVRVYASGLRNPYDLVFDAQGRLWATENGSDAPCATIDELNLIQEGGDYGWPYGSACDPARSGIPPAGDLGLHTASTGIDFYGSTQFPAAYRGNLFATLWGSLVFTPEPFGPSLVRMVIQGGGGANVEAFGTGFQHPIDVVVDRDGSLLVLDYGSGERGTGKLYRIVYTGG